jgi:hypothetical protein
VASLTQLRDTRSLTLGESGTLARAKRLLVCEISEVLGEPKTTVEEQIDHALNKTLIEPADALVCATPAHPNSLRKS